MNVIHLLGALFFVSTTICSNPEMPLVFFVKAFRSLNPLVVMPKKLDDNGSAQQLFTYNLSGEGRAPTEFKLDDRRASVFQESDSDSDSGNLFAGKVSIFKNYLTVNSTGKPMKLKWNRHMKLKKAQFYSCSDSTYMTQFIMVERGTHLCFKVDIYLLPYDRHNKKAVPPVPPQLPMALFLKNGDTFEPLSSIELGEKYYNMSIFTHNYPQAPPVRIWYVEHMLHIYPTKYIREWVGFHQGMFFRGSTVPKTTIFLDSSWRVLHGPLYSCALNPKVANSVRAISSVIPEGQASFCVEVKIYLLPYRRIKGGATTGTRTSIEYLYEEDYIKPDFRKLRATGNAPLENPGECFVEEKYDDDGRFHSNYDFDENEDYFCDYGDFSDDYDTY